MTVSAGQADVASALARPAAALAGRSDVTALLTAICRECVALTGSASAAIACAEAPGRDLEHAVSSDETGMALAREALATDGGPWGECARTGALLQLPDLAAHPGRWPSFTRSALARGVRSVTVLPLGAGKGAGEAVASASGPGPRREGGCVPAVPSGAARTVGALALLGSVPLDAARAGLVWPLAEAAGAGITLGHELRQQEVAIAQLQTALTSRIVIEQAKGVLAERWGVAPEVAFDHLRRHARASQRRLSELAREVVSGTAQITAPDRQALA